MIRPSLAPTLGCATLMILPMACGGGGSNPGSSDSLVDRSQPTVGLEIASEALSKMAPVLNLTTGGDRDDAEDSVPEKARLNF